MNVTVESTGTLERRMRVELPIGPIEEQVDSRLKTVGRTAKIKGFRPGKVPPKVVKQRFGKQVREEVLGEVLQQSYTAAVAQERLHPAGGPKIEAEDVSGNVFVFTATFEVMPEVSLNGLDKIKIQRPDVQIGDDDIEDMLLNCASKKRPGKRSSAAAGTATGSLSISPASSMVSPFRVARGARYRWCLVKVRCCRISKKG